MDSWERFNETSLPPKKAFYSKLHLEDISDKGYLHAQKVWEEFGIRNLGEYHYLYVQSETSLLVDVNETFRDKCIEIYGLDPSYFFSTPGLAWQACLKKTKVKLELLTDIDMLLMVEKGTRGRITQSIHRYTKKNDKYMTNYDKSTESSYLIYLDANSLYGWAMSKKLPVNGFKWENDLSRFNESFIKNYNENSDAGYFLEVDIEYPKQLWSFHKDLPFLPKREKLEKVGKLVCSIENKEKYVIHTRALKQALNHGLVLKDVYRVIKFNQEAWLKLYIDMNTKLRTETKNEFEKYFFKLMNNSVFRKTMENVRKHRDIKLVTTDERRNKLVSEPNYHTTKQFSENLLAIEMKKTKLKMNKPIYLGMSILDVSKTPMYEFWYDYIKPKYKEKAKLCYMDTDSFVINVFTEEFFEDINNDVERWFDMSNYDKNDKTPLSIGKNKKLIAMFKDDLEEKIMKEFCVPRAKTYAYFKDDDSE